MRAQILNIIKINYHLERITKPEMIEFEADGERKGGRDRCVRRSLTYLGLSYDVEFMLQAEEKVIGGDVWSIHMSF